MIGNRYICPCAEATLAGAFQLLGLSTSRERKKNPSKLDAVIISQHTPADTARKLDKNFTLANPGDSFLQSISRLFFQQTDPDRVLEAKALPEGVELKNESYRVGGRDVYVSSTIGERESMQDEHLVAEMTTIRGAEIQIFAVFDGHGGEAASIYLKEKYAEHFRTNYETFLDFSRPDDVDDAEWQNCVVENAMRFTITSLQSDWLNEHTNDRIGSTACVAIIVNEILYVGNLGDSRAILNDGGKTINLSKDQKPEDPRQLKRIKKLGGWVMQIDDVPRIRDTLAVGGSFGNTTLIGVPHKTDVIAYDLKRVDKKNNFLILACDGLWDVVSSKEAVNWKREGQGLKDYASDLVSIAYHQRCNDNITVMALNVI